MDELVKNNKVLTFVGTGGVGKTTLSMSVALYAASKGLRVAAITVDPSRRLATALGLESNSFQYLKWDSFTHPMGVYFLDVEKAFAEFVQESISENVYEKVKENRIFQQISKNLRETHNFAAIYRLDRILSDDNYDLIILDTPPSHQAIEFFESPQKLQRFFTKKENEKNSGLMSWIQEKGAGVVENIMMNIAGKEFVSETENFFSHIGQLREEIYKVSQNFLENMKSPRSQLILVGSPALDKLSEATYLQRKILEQGYRIRWCVINRSYYRELDFGKEPLHLQDPGEQELYNYFVGQKRQSMNLVGQLKSEDCFLDTQFVLLPEFSGINETEKSLLELAAKVSRCWQTVN